MKKQTFVVLLGGFSMMTLLAACAPAGFQSAPTAANGTNKSDTNVVEDRCIPDATDYLWDVNVYGFGMSGTNIDIGYRGPLVGPINQVDLGVKINKGTLNLAMDIQKPYDTAKRMVSADVSMTSDFNFAIDIGIVKLGFGSSSDAQAALVKLTSKGYQALLKSATSSVSSDPNPWSTHITRQLDSSRFVIPVGSLAGIQYGDKFDVYKYQYEWANPAQGCSSGAVGGSKLSAKVVATLVPLEIRDGSTTLTLVGAATTPITVNDLVQVNALFKTSGKRAALKKSVRILGVHQPNHIVIAGAGAIDLSSYLNYQMQPLMNTSGFWVVP